jgi:CDGSH-type Zn-finger protein/uncharacterized Fe-S cluster protein YjdI
MSEVEIVDGQTVRIVFDASKCIHARQCVLARPDVFVPNVQGQWIHPDRATPAEIAELAHNCPSGAITYKSLDGGADETAPRVNRVAIRENGPLAVHADIHLGGQSVWRATLCRCGASANKPWCDGSHKAAGFEATGEPASATVPAPAERDGPLTINPLKDGPLVFEGNVEIVSGTGRTIERTAKAALCRCGHSANKPFCDGAHVKAGFTTD